MKGQNEIFHQMKIIIELNICTIKSYNVICNFTLYSKYSNLSTAQKLFKSKRWKSALKTMVNGYNFVLNI